MNFTYPLDYILGQPSKIKILRFLIKSGVSMNGREIGKAVGLSHVRCHTILKELSEQGIVSFRQIGRSTVYELQQNHIVIKDWLKPLFKKEDLLKNSFARTVTNFLSIKPLSVILFGSMSKKLARAESDIDILLVMPDKVNLKSCKREIIGLEENITRLYGNHLSPLFIKRAAFIRKLKTGDQFLKEVLKSGCLIYGRVFAELLTDDS